MRDNVDVMERIARLRERLTAPQPAHAAGAAEGALGKRLSQVKFQLESHNFDSSGLAMALLDPMEMAEPFESTPTARNPEADPILESPEFRNLRERIEEFIQEFADWGSVDSATRSQVPHQASTFEGIDADTILWADRQRQAYSLAEFTRNALRACEGSVNRQLRVLPALHSIHNQLTLIRDQLAFQSSRRGRDRAVLNSIRDTHQRAMDGNLPSRTELDSLVHSLLEMRLTESIPPLTSFHSPDHGERLAEHSLNTAKIVSFLTSRDADLAPLQEELVLGAVLMDAGMLGIPTAVIDRDGPMSDEERKLLERHPLVASVLLDNLASFPREISEAISRHHERLNGTGYPQHLTGEHLDPIARMYAVADVFVALRCRRPYRSAYSQKQALTQLLEQVEQGCLDEHWCCSLLNIGLYPVGAIVELSTGETAEVVAPQEARSQPALAALPIVRMLSDREGNPFPANQFQNLAQYPHLRIVRLIP